MLVTERLLMWSWLASVWVGRLWLSFGMWLRYTMEPQLQVLSFERVRQLALESKRHEVRDYVKRTFTELGYGHLIKEFYRRAGL